MPNSHYQCNGPTGLSPNCNKNAGSIATIFARSCSEHIMFSSERTFRMSIPVILGKQNEFDYAVASMTAQDVRKISFIPSLDFSLSMQRFTEETHNVLRSGSPVLKWQRPLDASREQKIARYFWNEPVGASGFTKRESLIPGAVVLGDAGRENTNVSIHSFRMPNHDISEVRIEFQLLEQCPTCSRDATDPTYPEPDQPYFSQCWHHGCTNHGNSVEPLQIIDGQHRTNGILMNSIIDEVPVVFLIRTQEHNPNPDEIGFIQPDWRGIDLALQAEIFERVNNGAVKLNKLHSRWISVVLNGSTLPNHEVEAFRLFCETSGVRPSSRWYGMNLYHPLSHQQPLLESLTLSEFSQNLLGTPNKGLKRYNHLISELEQIERFLQGAISSTAGELFTGTQRPFRSPMIMSRILQSFDHMVQHAYNCGASLSPRDFQTMWDLHSSNWRGYTSHWATFRTGGESPQNLFLKFWNKMWEKPTGQDYGVVDLNHTYVDSGGKSQSISWGELAGRTPLSSITTLTTGASNSVIRLELHPPFNAYGSCTIEVSMMYASGNNDFLTTTVNHNYKTPTIVVLDFSTLFSIAASPGDKVEIEIRYSNQNGPGIQKLPTHTF